MSKLTLPFKKHSFWNKFANNDDKREIIKTLGLDLPLAATVTVADSAEGTAIVTIQLKDSLGDNVAAIQPVEVLIGGAARVVADIGTLGTVTPNTLINTITTDALFRALTSATGSLSFVFTPTTLPDEVFVSVIVQGKLYSGSGTVAAVLGG